MPAILTAPKLPAEVLLCVFCHLRRHDLAQVCKVNSYFRQLARPLFYRFGTFTKFGLHFPGAPNPYPYLDIPELGVERLSPEEITRISSNLREVDVWQHSPSDCYAFQNAIEGCKPRNVDVLHVAAAQRLLEAYGEEIYWGEFPHDIAFPRSALDNWDRQCVCSECAPHCFFLSLMERSASKLGKVVLREAPLGWHEGFYGMDLPELWPSREFVAVLDSHDITDHADTVWDCQQVFWGLQPLWPAPTVTIVLWTGAAGGHWMPPCVHFDHLFDENPDPADEVDPDAEVAEGAQPVCDAMARFWRDTGKRLPPGKCTTLRIVNAAAILDSYPNGEERYERRILSLDSIREHIMEGAREEAWGGPKSSHRHWEGEVQFLTMEEWIATGDWEDVFTREEMEEYHA